MAQANIKAVITAEDRASAALAGFGNKVGGVGKKIASAMKVAAVAAGAATAALITFSLNQFRDIQKNVAGIQALTKNTKEAKRVLKDAIDFVQGKPFDRLDTIGASKQLLAFGRTANQIKGDLKTLGNTVLISGIDWTHLTRVYGRVVSSGKLLREDFNILNDAGVGLAKTLQDELGTNMQGVFEKMEDGEISAEIFQRALKKAAPDSAVEKSLNTFDNKLLSLKAKLRDVGFAILGVDFNELSDGAEPLVKEGGLLDRLTDGMDAVTNALRGSSSFMTGLSERMKNLASGGIAFLKIAFDVLKPSVVALFNTIQNQLAPTLRKLWKEVLEPLAPVIGVVLVGALLVFVNVLSGTIRAVSSLINFGLRLVGAMKSVINIIRGVIAVFISVGRVISSAIQRVVQIDRNLRNSSVAWRVFRRAAESALGPIAGVIKGIISAVNKLIKKIRQAKQVGDKVGVSISDSIKSSIISSVPGGRQLQSARSLLGFQTGTNFAPGGMSLVGERGPEIVNLPRGSRVRPNDKTEKVMRNNQPNVNITIQAGAFMGNQQDARKYAEMIFRAYSDLVKANPSKAVI